MLLKKRKALTLLDINITKGNRTTKRYCQDVPQIPSLNRPRSPCATQSSQQTKGKTRTDPFQLPGLPNFFPFRAEYPLHTSRANLPPEYGHDPFSIFSLFFSDEVFEEITKNTNRYAAWKKEGEKIIRRPSQWGKSALCSEDGEVQCIQ